MIILYITLLANIIVFLLMSNGKLDLLKLAESYDTVINQKQFYRIITAAFTHRSIIHIIFNMIALYGVGRVITVCFGTLGFAFIYFGSIIIGQLLSLYIHHKNGQDNVYSVGASGGICGLIGAYLVLVITLYGFAGISRVATTLGYMIIMSFLPNVDGMTHISCFAVGIGLAYLLTILL